MGRGLNTKQIKNVIDFLKVKPATWTELKTLEIPDNSLARILKEYLRYWGLVYYDADARKWCLHARIDEVKKTDTILFARSGATRDEKKALGSFPLRDYDLIEFFKLCSQQHEIVLIEIDLESSIISLMHQGKKET